MSRFMHTVLCLTVLLLVYTGNVKSSTTQHTSFEITQGINGLEKLILRQIHGSSLELYRYGAHVTSWKNKQGEELLFVSRESNFQPPKPIRGGIPIIFPQFSNLGSLQSHGFARNRLWSIESNPPPFPQHVKNEVFVDLLLKPTDEDLKIWPHRFEFRLRVALGLKGNLVMTSRIKNTDTEGKPFTFTFAYHTYYSVSNISEVRVEGLQSLDYLDNTRNRSRFTDPGDAITFESEVDKIYLSTPKQVAVLDKKKRTFVIRKDGLPDAVVWNPWEKRAKTMADFGDDEYLEMVCLEAAAIGKPITLNPGEEWKGRQELSAVPLSYCSGKLDPNNVPHCN